MLKEERKQPKKRVRAPPTQIGRGGLWLGVVEYGVLGGPENNLPVRKRCRRRANRLFDRRYLNWREESAGSLASGITGWYTKNKTWRTMPYSSECAPPRASIPTQ